MAAVECIAGLDQAATYDSRHRSTSENRQYSRCFRDFCPAAERIEEPARRGTNSCESGLGRSSSERLPDLRVPRLQRLVDEIAALIVRQECALHRVDRELFKIFQCETKSLCGRLEFTRHRRVTHQPIVGIERHTKFCLIKNLEGMLRQARCGTGMDVADQADLQRNSLVQHILR